VRDGPLRILTVCTGNICRSVVAERALARKLAARGIAAQVRSAGTLGELANDPDTVRAAREAGLELADHRSRRLTPDVITTDGADLIVAMTRAHLREVVALDPSAWPRTFTMKELARRTALVGRGECSFTEWRRAVAGDRTAAGLMSSSHADDVTDPHGEPYRAHVEMVSEVTRLADLIAAHWPLTAH
jgi:protein-tyrosine phosphatase